MKMEERVELIKAVRRKDIDSVKRLIAAGAKCSSECEK